MRCIVCFAISMLVLCLLFTGIASGEGLSGEQEKALSTLVVTLTNMEAHPDDIDKLRAQIYREREQARTQSSALDKEIAELSELLEQVGNQLDDLSSRLESFASGKRPTRAQVAVFSSDPVSFNRDIRPVLSKNCYACHGPGDSTRKAGLRLDTEEGTLALLKSGNHAIVPGDRSASSVYERITTSDEADRMPPGDSEKTLTAKEIELLVRWIDQGAKWEKHWAFVTPTRPDLPEIIEAGWARNPIDRYILARLQEEGLSHSPKADNRTLIRRVTLDLTGLPPTREELHAFLDDESPNAYEKVVDRLLASPRYGEHFARDWLDVARYADTNGYHIDNERFMWRWRDWVIQVLNDNKPFDEFVIEQLAGDLLGNPTLDQLIATGFNRNHMINFEGGAIPEEYRVQYVKDRVTTTGTAFMGLTLDCAHCHDHKFDPITQTEFYQMYAYFNTIGEKGLDGREGLSEPYIKAPRPEEKKKLEAMEAVIQERRKNLDRPIPQLDKSRATWEATIREEIASKWETIEPVELKGATGTQFALLYDLSVLVLGENPIHDVYEFYWDTDLTTVHALRLETLTHSSLPKGGLGRADKGDFYLSGFEAEVVSATDSSIVRKVVFENVQGDQTEKKYPLRNAIDGKPDTSWGFRDEAALENKSAVFAPRDPIKVGKDNRLRIRLRHEHRDGGGIGRFRVSASTDPMMALSKLGPWYLSGPFKATDGQYAHETAYTPEKDPLDVTETYEDGRQKWVRIEPEFEDGKVHPLSGEICATYLYRKIESPCDRTVELSLCGADTIKVWVNGQLLHDNPTPRGVDPDQDQEKDLKRDRVTVDLSKGDNELLIKVVNYGNDYAFYFRRGIEQVGEVPFEIERTLAMNPEEWNEEQTKSIRDYYRSSQSDEWKTDFVVYTALVRELKEFEASIPTVMVMKEMAEPRETRLLVRGDYDKPGDLVQAKLPAAFPPMPQGAPNNRLGFAKWLVDPTHPLTARVVVNRYWRHFFGTGIVKTTEDFGTQGERPVHPELLDWLATEFIRSGWDVKRMHKLIVTSAAYRQSPKTRPALLEKDPENRLLAKGPRYRLDAEVVRDTALAIGGLLVEKIGGPSVKPYQPTGLWKEVAFGGVYSAQVFEPDSGENLYRRSMYTFWKRQCPPPQMLVFDAPNREVCTSRRTLTNTPLQALALLNDPQYVEAARSMGERIMKEGGENDRERIAFAFELATSRLPEEKELEILARVYREELEYYQSDPQEAKKLIAFGESSWDENLDPCELAAWTQLANTLLNLDEVITKG